MYDFESIRDIIESVHATMVKLKKTLDGLLLDVFFVFVGRSLSLVLEDRSPTVTCARNMLTIQPITTSYSRA